MFSSFPCGADNLEWVIGLYEPKGLVSKSIQKLILIRYIFLFKLKCHCLRKRVCYRLLFIVILLAPPRTIIHGECIIYCPSDSMCFKWDKLNNIIGSLCSTLLVIQYSIFSTIMPHKGIIVEKPTKIIILKISKQHSSSIIFFSTASCNLYSIYRHRPSMK